jgi:aminoglycoside phosphotransferase (APT) family kinase protein
MHGDYVPWNLREDDRGQLWLLDWEDAGWGPPGADLVRYLVAYHSLAWSSAERTAVAVRRMAGGTPAEGLIEIVRFWLAHPNLQPADEHSFLPSRRARDSARAAREIAAFRLLLAAT